VIKWMTGIYAAFESRGNERYHIAVPPMAREKLIEMSNELVGTEDLVALYVPVSTEANYLPEGMRGRIIATAELLPMPPDRRVEDYSIRYLLDESLRWPFGWPCRVVDRLQKSQYIELKPHVETLVGLGSFPSYMKQLHVGPFKLDEFMQERLNADLLCRRDEILALYQSCL
jgi:hypothetical protein